MRAFGVRSPVGTAPQSVAVQARKAIGQLVYSILHNVFQAHGPACQTVREGSARCKREATNDHSTFQGDEMLGHLMGILLIRRVDKRSVDRVLVDCPEQFEAFDFFCQRFKIRV